MNMKIFLSMLIVCFSAEKAIGQAEIQDPGNISQSIIIAGNTASTVRQAVEQAKKLQTTLDYIQKVSAAVRHARMFKDLIDRQNRLNSSCLKTIEEARSLNLDDIARVTSSIQGVIGNNAAIIELTTGILSTDLKMNDAGRMQQLKKCLAKIRKEEEELAAIRQIIAHTGEIRRNLGIITK